eukprot:m.752846 g.752846  ORF g.752846 m.752846 type:complete len:381 (-) comp23171_c0_seq11:2540-3682(-)
MMTTRSAGTLRARRGREERTAKTSTDNNAKNLPKDFASSTTVARYGLWTAFLCGLLFLVVPYVSVGVMCSAHAQRFILMLHWVKNPFTDLSELSTATFGSHGVQEFTLYQNNSQHSTIRGWHILPTSEASKQNLIFNKDTLTRTSARVVMYMHGNAGTRGSQHRLDLYKLLRSQHFQGMHVVTFDYRGYADAVGVPDIDGLVEDAEAVWRWILAQGVSASHVTLWGHSLGSGVACALALRLQRQTGTVQPHDLVLEAPFISLGVAARSHPLGAPVRWLSAWGMDEITRCLAGMFENGQVVGKLTLPTLILHGTHDRVVSWDNGNQLHDIARAERADAASVTFVTFDGVGHDDICYDARLVHVLQVFWDSPPSAGRGVSGN